MSIFSPWPVFYIILSHINHLFLYSFLNICLSTNVQLNILYYDCVAARGAPQPQEILHKNSGMSEFIYYILFIQAVIGHPWYSLIYPFIRHYLFIIINCTFIIIVFVILIIGNYYDFLIMLCDYMLHNVVSNFIYIQVYMYCLISLSMKFLCREASLHITINIQ